MTGLSFDPPDKSQRRVEKAISEAASKISSKLCRETQLHCRDALQAQIDFLNQQSVILVGGSTRMPMIRNTVEALFPGKVRGEDSNLAISKGATLCSKLL